MNVAELYTKELVRIREFENKMSKLGNDMAIFKREYKSIWNWTMRAPR